MTRDQLTPIPGLEGYSISADGKIWSDRSGRYLRPHAMPSGHLVASLRRDGTAHTELVHRLVALTFIGPPPPNSEVCHNDGDPGNNRLENLRYGTRSENVLDQVRHGVHNNASKTHCKNGHPFDAERSDGKGRRCSVCLKASQRSWYLANTELAKERARKHKAAKRAASQSTD